MGFTGLKLGVAAVGGVIFTMAALVQSAAADPIYHLEAGEYSVTSGVGTFIIPSVAEGLLFYLDADDPPTEITLTGLYHSDDKVRCIAITRSTYACSTEGTSQADSGDGHGWQSDGQGSAGNDPLGHGSNGNDPPNSLVNNISFDPPLPFQIANLANDTPAGPTSVPEPGSLILLASALLTLGVTTRRLRRQ
jgi:hypothetical protein